MFAVSIHKKWSPCDWLRNLIYGANKSKNGLVSLNGKDYFPKEYLEVEERQGNNNFVDNISSYFRNIVYENPFHPRPQNHLEFEQQSENDSQVSNRDNIEEGKSLIEDFNRRPPLYLSESPRHNNSVDSEAQDEPIEQNNSGHMIILPPIISEESQQSHYSDYMNINSRNINLFNPLTISQREGSSVSDEAQRSLRFIQINQLANNNQLEEIKLNKNLDNLQNKSLPKICHRKQNLFEKINELDYYSDLNSSKNHMQKIEKDDQCNDPIVPFQEYSNASKMINSKPNWSDNWLKLSFNKQNHLETNFSKSFENLKSSEKIQKLDLNNDKNISIENQKVIVILIFVFSID